MPQIPTKIRAFLKEKGPVKTYKEGQPGEFRKVLATLVTIDEQVLFVEIRNKKIEETQHILENSVVNVEIIFLGSEKNSKRYNNLIVTKMTKM